jgi:folate-binding protein YgfZ
MTTRQNTGVKSQKTALRIRGKDAPNFLNGMLTQDIKRAFEQTPSCGRAFFLTPKGKIISELYFIVLNAEETLLLCAPQQAQDLKDSLEKFLIADKVEISLDQPYDYWDLPESEFSLEALKNRHPLGKEKIFPALIHKDFIVLPRQQLSTTHCHLLVLNNQNLPPLKNLSADQHWQMRFDQGIPQWGEEIKEGDFFLEFPLSDTVSFDKGCYVGQETVSRGTFRGKVNKTFAKITANKEIPLGEVVDENSLRVGEILSTQNNQALGIFKLSLPENTKFFLQKEAFELKVEPLVNEKTFRGER